MSNNTNYFKFKKGSTFSSSVAYVPPEGSSHTLENITIKSQIADFNGCHLADVTITKHDDLKGFDCEVLDTSDWPTDELKWDIKFTDDISGEVYYSDTITIDVVRNITA